LQNGIRFQAGSPGKGAIIDDCTDIGDARTQFPRNFPSGFFYPQMNPLYSLRKSFAESADSAARPLE